MLERLLPSRADNAYHGHKLALWLFAVVVMARESASSSTLDVAAIATLLDVKPGDRRRRMVFP